MENRRDFIQKASLLSAGFALSGGLENAFARNTGSGLNNAKHPICYFTKHLQWLDYNDLGIALNEAGFDGADLTVRSGGHVEPEQAASELPKAVSALQKHGISIPMVVTRVADPKEKGLETLLKALADNGVQYYRMGYLNYDFDLPIQRNIEIFHEKLEKLAELNAKT